MGAIQSVSNNDVAISKSGKFTYKTKTYHLKDLVEHYNNIVEKLQFFEKKAYQYLKERDHVTSENEKLRIELNQLKNVLDVKLDMEEKSMEPSDDLEAQKSARYGISAETTKASKNVKVYPKSREEKHTIADALKNSDFLEHLDKVQIKDLIDCMKKITVAAGDFIIKEGDIGDTFYIIEKGTLEVTKKGQKLHSKPLGPGKIFGELAILYNCSRTASIRAITESFLWEVNRNVFQSVMQNSVTDRRKDHVEFLKSVSILKDLDDSTLKKIADGIDELSFQEGDFIIREGEKGNAFYIIKTGEVQVLKMNSNYEMDVLRKLTKGDYFGEKALLKGDIRSASIKTTSFVSCLSLERDIFTRIAGRILQGMEKKYDDEDTVIPKLDDSHIVGNIRHQTQYIFNDFLFLCTLGQGAFGKVDLVEHSPSKKRFALKRMEKQHIVKTKQQDHIRNEREVLGLSDSTFIIKLYQTFKDSKYIYLLIDACLGGDLFTILHTVKSFDPKAARFYVACVIEAFEYVHTRGYIYRDLKPENMIMDATGYVKLVDFGFAKKINDGEKTFTFCGTPEYVAPEIILSKGHDKSADYWSLGILVYELINGNPPFTSGDSMTTYRMILKGIDSISFSKKLPKYAAALCRSLCKDNPTERLGNQKEGISAIKKHRWFEGFHWTGLQSKTLPAPLLPNINKYNKPLDLSPLKMNLDSNPRYSDWELVF